MTRRFSTGEVVQEPLSQSRAVIADCDVRLCRRRKRRRSNAEEIRTESIVVHRSQGEREREALGL
jgi:hypothetical protein